MNNYVDRLINVGYTPSQARGVYDLYFKHDDLRNLDHYITSKEAIARAEQVIREGGMT